VNCRFDRYGSAYREEVERSIAFARTDSAFFTELKAVDLVALARRRLGSPGDVKALDFGCGTGNLDTLVAPSFKAVHGVDVSQGLLDVAARENPGVGYQRYDGGRLPYEDACFDLAFAVCVFHHIEPASRAVAAAELFRVVRSGGLVAIYEHNPLNPLTRLAVSRCEFDEDVELLTPAAAKGLLRHAGLGRIETRYIVFLPWRAKFLRTLERHLARMPLGAQYAVAALRP
jgi:SAM-dependent methyltransferase